MKLRKLKKLLYGLFGLSVVFLTMGFLGIALEIRSVKLIGLFGFMGILFPSAIMALYHFKCPKCGQHPGRNMDKYCTHCGQYIDDDTELGARSR